MVTVSEEWERKRVRVYVCVQQWREEEKERDRALLWTPITIVIRVMSPLFFYVE